MVNAAEPDEQLITGGNLANDVYLLRFATGAPEKVFHFVIKQ